MKFWAVVFLVATSLVAVMKQERDESEVADQQSGDQDLGVLDTYKLVEYMYNLLTQINYHYPCNCCKGSDTCWNY